MRRIYESRAVERDADDPFKPGEDGVAQRGSRTIDWQKASHALLPKAIRRRAITVTVETSNETYAPEEPVHFTVEMQNRLPVPVSIVTRSPVLWTWAVDGAVEASRQSTEEPDVRGLLTFGRSETKVFSRRWSQRIENDDSRWQLVRPDEYTISAWINSTDGDDQYEAETTVSIE